MFIIINFIKITFFKNNELFIIIKIIILIYSSFSRVKIIIINEKINNDYFTFDIFNYYYHVNMNFNL